MPRPFCFGVDRLTPASAGAWRAKCGRAEELRHDVVLVPDRLSACRRPSRRWSRRPRRPSGPGSARSCVLRSVPTVKGRESEDPSRRTAGVLMAVSTGQQMESPTP